MHLSMFIWLYRIPFGYRRRMKQRDSDYRNHLKLQTILIKPTSSQINLNDCLEKINNKDKFTLLNISINDDMKTGNDISKDRMAYF
jgi:hypothetical protein